MTLAETLSREIERVSDLRGSYRARKPEAAADSTVRGMSAALQFAHEAFGSGDLNELARALTQLKAWS